MRVPDAEDHAALTEYLKRFVALPPLPMNDAERLNHYFAAGFFRGMDFALGHKAKVVCPTEPVRVLNMDVPTIRSIKKFAESHGWKPHGENEK